MSRVRWAPEESGWCRYATSRRQRKAPRRAPWTPVSVLKARAGQPEVIEAVVKRDTRHGDAQAVHLGEVGQPETTGFVYLTEHDVTLLAMECAPVANPALQCAAHVAREVGMAPKHLVQYGDRPDAGSGLEQRHDLGVKDCRQGIGTATST